VTSRALLLLFALVPSIAGAAALCNFTSTPGMGFGAYDDSSPGNTDSSTSLTVQCFRIGGPADVDVTLQIGPSATSGGTAPRQMAGPAGNRMNYNLYRDSGRSQVWGQSLGVDTGTVTITNISNGSFKTGTIVVYGRIPAQQSVATGAYSDSVQLTISP
jgi:spore coat protein U-like protein